VGCPRKDEAISEAYGYSFLPNSCCIGNPENPCAIHHHQNLSETSCCIVEEEFLFQYLYFTLLQFYSNLKLLIKKGKNIPAFYVRITPRNCVYGWK
jgi:hypothetical protein